MPKINPRTGRTVAIIAVFVALFGEQRADMARLEARLETGLAEPCADIAGLRDRTAGVEAGLAMTGERMARVEGAVRVARAADTDESAAN